MSETFTYKFDDLFNVTLNAFHNLGGSASIEEIEDQARELLNLNEKQISEKFQQIINTLL